MPVPDRVCQLVEDFQSELKLFTSPRYKEQEVREAFINPLFEALGWDVHNLNRAPYALQEVIREYSLRSAEALREEEEIQEAGPAAARSDRRPDYAFHLDGKLKFFVEAKKPARNIESDRYHAFQIRSYGWNASLPVGVLTDFQELALYDCATQPSATDDARPHQLKYYTFDKYAEQWDELVAILSREAVLGGSLEAFGAGRAARRGTTTVDAAFLKEISTWRQLLAEDIAGNNPALTQRELNYAVQMLIDRIIFLRIAEDRGTEPYERLRGTIAGKGDVYLQLVNLFRAADDRYNSGLFHFKRERGRDDPDAITPTLRITNESLKQIIARLYYPESPYKFSVMPIEILGNVYEQFLGQVIELAPDCGVNIELKPEVRKAGGVYYTPTYIVEYIVRNTVGKLLEGKTPAEAAQLRILDPACGSGSFLIGAYGYLLDWYLQRYLDEGAVRHKRKLVEIRPGEYRLTLEERKRVLLNNIYGVDIDTQAVEVAKLSLLLKVMEDESIPVRQSGFEQERLLPDLSNNIKCGNSLIGPDYYERQGSFLDTEEMLRVNAFAWEEAFPEIMKGGGFDAVIGNPPYIGFHGFAQDKTYLRKTYISAEGKFDYYLPFIEKGLGVLRQKGVLGYICPTNFTKRGHGKSLRDYLRTSVTVLEICDFEDVQIFQGALNYTGVFVLQNTAPHTDHQLRYRARSLDGPELFIRQSELGLESWIFRGSAAGALVRKVEAQPVQPLGKLASGIAEGIVTGQNAVFLMSRDTAAELDLEEALLRPCVRGREIRRYWLEEPKEVVVYPYVLTDGKTKPIPEAQLPLFANAWQYLNSRRPDLAGRPYFDASSKAWYELWCQRDIRRLSSKKIVVPELSDRNRFALADETQFYGDTVCGITLLPTVDESLLYILGLLNSRLLEFYYKQSTVPKANQFYIYKTMFLKNIPIRTIDFTNPTDKARHDRMVSLVERMLDLHKQLATANTPAEKSAIERAITATDRQIDDLVYDLYGLTEEERAIVEG